MRWAFDVSALNRNSSTGSGAHSRCHGAHDDGTPSRSIAESAARPASSPERYTRSCSSTAHSSPPWLSRECTVTNTISPVRPCLTVTSPRLRARSVRRPNSRGLRTASRPPAIIRRRSGRGGRKCPSAGWPSAPRSLWRGQSGKYTQCHNGGNAPVPGSASSTADRAAARDGSRSSWSVTGPGRHAPTYEAMDMPLAYHIRALTAGVSG